MALLHTDGVGVNVDYLAAYSWFRKAVSDVVLDDLLILSGL